MLDTVAHYHFMQFQGKLVYWICENGKKNHFGPDFDPFWLKFGPKKKILVGFISTKYYTLLQAIIVCNFKEN